MNLNAAVADGRMRYIEAAMRLLESEGPAEIKARGVAREVGTTTMGLYTHFNSVPELVKAVVDEGFKRQAAIFNRVPKGANPMANLYALALACRKFAGHSPRLYDLMYGLSIHGRYNNTRGSENSVTHEPPPNFKAVFEFLFSECVALLRMQSIDSKEPLKVAYQFWSALHGFVMLDLAGHFRYCADSVQDVLLPMCINVVVGMGVSRQEAELSANIQSS